MNIAQWQKAAYANAVLHGFHEDDDATTVDRRLMLITSEIVEAHEEIRDGHDLTEIYYRDGKPEGVPVELADVVIRVLDFCETYGIDLEVAMSIKQSYNAGRPHKHGRRF